MTSTERAAAAKKLLDLALELADRATELLLDEMWEKYHPGEDRPRWPRQPGG